MGKKRIVFGYLAFPFAIASYFRHALEKRPDVELFTVGPYTGDYIPWNSGMRLPMKYVKKVDLPLPTSITTPSWEMIKGKIPWEPDLVIAVDAGFYFSTKPSCPYAIVATDPHVLNYNTQRTLATHFFNMQREYMSASDVHLPYCCSPDHHYVINGPRDYDASLIGLHYRQRDLLVSALRSEGLNVLYDIGLVYDEYREQNNRAKIGLNWSSLKDINARIMESMAMRQVLLTNRLPHMEELGLKEGEHYFGFDTVEEAVFQAKWILANFNQAMEVSQNAHDLVHQKHTYEKRIQKIFDEVGI